MIFPKLLYTEWGVILALILQVVSLRYKNKDTFFLFFFFVQYRVTRLRLLLLIDRSTQASNNTIV